MNFYKRTTRYLLICLLVVSHSAQSQQNDVQSIRKLYYQNLQFDTINVISNKMIPGLGLQNMTVSYVYYDCKYLDCEESIHAAKPVLRKMILDRYVNTLKVHTEFLYAKSGEVRFCFKRISSEDYYERTGRECGEERYYFQNGQPILINIIPCQEDEPFDPIELTKDYPTHMLNDIQRILLKSELNYTTFTKLLETVE